MQNRHWTNYRLFRLPENPLFRLLAVNGLIGVGISLLVLAGVFATNIGNLRTLVVQADNPVLPVVMLAAGLVITLGSVVMGSAVMLLPEGKDTTGRPKGLRRPMVEPVPAMIPVRVAASPRARR